MKPYSPTTSRARYYALRRWIRISSMASALLLFCMALLYIPEYFIHNQLKNQHSQLQSIALKNGTITPDSTAINVTFAKIKKRQKQANGPVTLLKKIKSLCKDDSNLELLSIKRHDLQITLAAKNAPALVSIADNLAQQPSYSQLYISSLEPKEQRMIATLKSHQEIKNS